MVSAYFRRNLDLRTSSVEVLFEISNVQTLNWGRINQGRIDQIRIVRGRIDQGRIDQGRIDQGRIDQGRIDRGRIDQGRIDRGRIDRGRMDQSRIDQGRIDQNSDQSGRIDQDRIYRGWIDLDGIDQGRIDLGQIDQIRIDQIRIDQIRIDQGSIGSIYMVPRLPNSDAYGTPTGFAVVQTSKWWIAMTWITWLHPNQSVATYHGITDVKFTHSICRSSKGWMTIKKLPGLPGFIQTVGWLSLMAIIIMFWSYFRTTGSQQSCWIILNLWR